MNKALKDLDRDQNGFLTLDELETVFKELFSVEFEGKSMVVFFRKYSLSSDQNFINYRKMKEDIQKMRLEEQAEQEDKNMVGQMNARNLYRLQETGGVAGPVDRYSNIDKASRRTSVSGFSKTSSMRRKSLQVDKLSQPSLPSIRSTSCLNGESRNFRVNAKASIESGE